MGCRPASADACATPGENIKVGRNCSTPGITAAMTLVSRLPRSLKRQIRLAGCRAIGLWRRYPNSRGLQCLPPRDTALWEARAHTWQTSTTPIPNRGDATTRSNRLHNLSTAISRINHRLIKPGETFSLSQHLDEPTEANGYRSGPVFVGGEVLSDVGGGLCLIATNLYQLFLYGGCSILERHNHSIDAYGEGRFYKLGEDAAIAFSYKDLVIRNRFDQALVLCTTIGSNAVHSRLLALGPKPIQTIIRSQVLERHAPISQDQTTAGWSVSTARFSRPIQAGSWRQDYLSFSHYQPC